MHSVQSKLSPKTVTVRNIRNRMITFYTAAIIIICLGAALLSVLSLNKLFSERTAGFLIDADAQLCKSADYFTANTETDCADVLKSDTITEYDPVAISYAEYENNSLKNDAGNELLKISAGKNYSDFAVIFSDGSSVGRFSTGTADSLSELSFSGFYELLGDKADKWIFGLGNDFRKIFYLRRITDHSMVLVSMYTAELNNVFITDAPHSDPVLSQPFHHKGCLIVPSPNSVKHIDQQDVIFPGKGILPNFQNGVPLLHSQSIARNTFF